jgi:hypothetical protein
VIAGVRPAVGTAAGLSLLGALTALGVRRRRASAADEQVPALASIPG